MEPSESSSLDAAAVVAAKVVSQLFRILGIERVVVVDDDFVRSVDFSDVLGKVQTLVAGGDKDSVRSVPHLDGISFEAHETVWTKNLRDLWTGLDVSSREEVASGLGLTALEPEEGTESPYEMLRKLIGTCDCSFLTLARWQRESDAILADSASKPTLLLFDQDMSKESGAKDQGIRIIAGLLQKHTDARIYFGLFSNLVGPNDEYSYHNELVENHQLHSGKDRFAVVSKSHLSQQPETFARRLKRIAIAPDCNKLRERVLQAIEKATAESEKKIKGISIYDFEEIVFQSSYAEGVWEPDTIFRLFGIFHHAAARESIKGDSVILELTNKVREVVSVQSRPDDSPGRLAHEVTKLELYEPSEFLTAHHTPLDLGDIFQRTRGGGLYVLLAQPCDLMVRGDTGRRIADYLTLVEITAERNEEDRPFRQPLPFFQSDEKFYYVDFRKAHVVHGLMLDLCVYSQTGESKIVLDQDCPVGVIPSWRLRFAHVKEAVGKIVGRYRAIRSALPAKKSTLPMMEAESRVNVLPGETDSLIQQALTSHAEGLVQGKIELSPDRLMYGLKRVGRLKQPRSSAVFRDFVSFVTRDAFEHDLTRTASPKK